jgi:hypothetical protein
VTDVVGGGRAAHRTCLGCRAVLDKDALVRYVLTPAREVTVDYRARLPGRGAYTCLKRSCLLAAVQRRQFNRTFKQDGLQVDGAQLLEQLRQQLYERVLSLVGMARKSNQVISGSSLVLSALSAPGAVALVILADDMSDAMAAKVSGTAQAHGVPCCRMFDKGLLGQILGKEERSAVAIRAGQLAEALRTELVRFEQIAGEHDG